MKTFCASVLAILATAASAQSSKGPDDRYRIVTTIQGTVVEGSQEKATRMAGKSAAERQAIINEPLAVLRSASRFQLQVSVTDPGGATTDYTKSSRLRYESSGCLTISARGAVTVTPSSPTDCEQPSSPMLFVVLLDANGKPISHNEYLFKVE